MIANPAFYGIDHQTHVYEHEYCIAVAPSDNALTIGQSTAVPVLLNMICTADSNELHKAPRHLSCSYVEVAEQPWPKSKT